MHTLHEAGASLIAIVAPKVKTVRDWALLLGGCLLVSAGLPVQAKAANGAILARSLNIPWPAVIGHRGMPFHAPECTRPSYLLARQVGADYLEVDLQRSRDGHLVAVHDIDLQRTTNISEKFPHRRDRPVKDFTLAELKTLDAGSWFNIAYPERARSGYVGLKILTLDEVIDIAEQEPTLTTGLYIETKNPFLFPGVERDLKTKLIQRNWLTADGNVTSGRRLILQSMEKLSFYLLNHYMPRVPKELMLWVGEGYMTPRSSAPYAPTSGQTEAAYFSQRQPLNRAEFKHWIEFAVNNGAIGTSPSAALRHGGEGSYMDLIQPWMSKITHDAGLLIHVYQIDDPVADRDLLERDIDGLFTDRADLLLAFYQRPARWSVPEILEKSGY